MTSIANLPNFIIHLAAGIALLAAGGWIYTRITPHDEMALIRANNTAAAIKLAGAILGLAQPVAAAIRGSSNLLDAIVWSVIAVLAQIAAFWVVQFILPDWRKAMEERGETAGAVLKAAIAIGVGMLNAACLSP
ncbi:DUF350 domain-containing protein [Muricoccus radiodurans]|uniref:DUF350 domain-containing protein n=1 Tax=Muricoccus radiodurans TaxID=2231721 RepID=UPI003CF9E8AC